MFQRVFAVASAYDPVASNNLRSRCGFAGDDVWLALLGEGMLATLLSFGELNRLGRLNRRFRCLHEGAWPAIWRARSKTCGSAELGRMLRLAVTRGKAAHVRELVLPMAEQGDASVLLQALNDEPSCLFLAVEGHVDVVKVLLEVGGRELVMMTQDHGVSCLWISAENGHLEVVKALLEAGGRELVMLTADDGASCLWISAQKGHLEVVKALLEAGGRELVMLTSDDGTSCLYISAQNGHLEVVKALLEAGGRELAMLTADDGSSCLSVACRANQGDMEIACKVAGLSSHEITILKRG
jgi:DNA-binding LacI/PurR family transcriptional regulator